jgi:hypothetical protein
LLVVYLACERSEYTKRVVISKMRKKKEEEEKKRRREEGEG